MMLGLPQGRHGWGWRGGGGCMDGACAGAAREVEGRGGAFWYEVPH
jgi:hypothetical protein